MKITYKFVTGEVAEVEVSEEIGAVIVDLDRQEYNNDHKETRRHYSLEGKVYEGTDYAVEDSGLEALFAGPTDEERLRTAIQQLNRQRRHRYCAGKESAILSGGSAQHERPNG